jgi:hypothetical protein
MVIRAKTRCECLVTSDTGRACVVKAARAATSEEVTVRYEVPVDTLSIGSAVAVFP